MKKRPAKPSSNRTFPEVQLTRPAVAKFAKEAMRQFDPAFTIVLMGDMNQSPAVIERL